MKLFYLYEIYITNEDSSLDGCYYYGKHEIDDKKTDNYFGSGAIIKKYIQKYGHIGLNKTIISYYKDSISLCEAEKTLVESKKLELGDKCLNIAEGGSGSWKHVNESLNEEQRKSNALFSGLGNKKRLENPEELESWKQKVREIHANRSIEEKTEMYSKVSESLKKFYSSPDGKLLVQEQLQNNIIKNKETSKQWRADFQLLFGHTPEYYRKYELLQEVCTYYKQIKLDENRTELANKFNEQLINITPKGFKCSDPETWKDNIRKSKELKRSLEDKFMYILDSNNFTSQYQLLSYINSTYFNDLAVKLSKKVLSDICAGKEIDSRVKLCIKPIALDIKNRLIVIEKEKYNE